MKKFIFFAGFALLGFVLQPEARAQFATATAKTSSGVDSAIVTDTGNANLFVTIAKPHAVYGLFGTFTKTSGTLGGTAKAQGSYDGTNWFDVGTNYTVANTSGAQYNSWALEGNTFPYKYARVLWTGTGTMAGRFRLKVYTVDY